MTHHLAHRGRATHRSHGPSKPGKSYRLSFITRKSLVSIYTWVSLSARLAAGPIGSWLPCLALDASEARLAGITSQPLRVEVGERWVTGV